jgi:ligand-binding sensor domain-containing protein
MFACTQMNRFFSMNCTSTPLIVSTRLLLTLIGLLFTSPEGFTQTFRHFSDADASGMIYSGGQDNKGFMWFATLNGVLRYDSHSFRRFLSKPDDSTSLASNYTTSLLCDSRGDVWVCTSSGLCRYEAGKESFQTFKPNLSNSDAISSKDVRALAEDKHGNVWIGTKDGLDRTETGSGNPKFTHYRLAGPDGTGLAVQGIEKGKNEELWLATSHGLVWFNQGKTKYFLAKADPRLPLINDFTYIFNDQTGNIWLGIRKGGLMRFNITSQTFELLADFKSPVGEWPDLSGFVEDKPGKVWMATTSGLVNFDLKTQQAKWYLNDPANDQSLEDNVLMSITKDRQGGLWLGSYYSRLDYLNTSAPSFSRWPFFNNRITNSKFTSSWMGLTPDQKLWLVSGDKSEILLYDLVSNQLSSHKLKVEFAGNANHFFIDENDVLWYGPAGSLVSYDFKKGTTKVYQAPDFKRVPKEKNDAFIIIQDRHQKLWLGKRQYLVRRKKLRWHHQEWERKARANPFE